MQMDLLQWLALRSALLLGMLAMSAGLPVDAQVVAAQGRDTGSQSSPTIAHISLDEAIRLAETNEPTFVAAAAESRALALGRRDARAALLPSVTYNNSVIYTEPNGASSRIGQVVGEPTPVFIANNAIREYLSQGVATETLGFRGIGVVRQADANAARALAEAEVARRGLVATVVNLYYGLAAQEAKITVAQRALDESNHFLLLTQQRESAREVAHADVLKAQLQQQQRERDLADSQLATSKARLEAGVLLFANPATPFEVDGLTVPPLLPDRNSVEAAARLNNPELRSALASVQASEADTYLARAALLPELVLNAAYGIDAPQVAKNGPDGLRNLGYSGSVTLDIPVWDWLTTERKIKESRLRRDAAKTVLTAAQRRLLADLSEFYDEADTARKQMSSLELSVVSARESLRLTNLRYADGESTVLEVVDAENTLTSTETAQADGRARYEDALAQLQTLSGRL